MLSAIMQIGLCGGMPASPNTVRVEDTDIEYEVYNTTVENVDRVTTPSIVAE